MSKGLIGHKPFEGLETINYGEEFFDLLLNLINNSDTLSIGGKFKSIEDLKNIKHIIIIGSSLCGKTTLLNDIKTKTINDVTKLTFSTRYVNRDRRESPDKLQNTMEDLENKYCTNEEFKQAIENGEIGINWERELAGKVSKYGFEKLSPQITEESDFIMYSANNAFVKEGNNLEGLSKEDLKEMLIIGVTTDDLVRLQRYQKRNPELSETPEGKDRMADESKKVVEYVQFTVDTTGGGDKPSDDMVSLLSKISTKKRVLDITSNWEEKTIKRLNYAWPYKYVVTETKGIIEAEEKQESKERDYTEYKKTIFWGNVAKKLFSRYESNIDLEYSKEEYLNAFLRYIEKYFFNNNNIDFNYNSKGFLVDESKNIINANGLTILENKSYIEQLLQMILLCLESDIEIFKGLGDNDIIEKVRIEFEIFDEMFKENLWIPISDDINRNLIEIYNNIKFSIENGKSTILPDKKIKYLFGFGKKTIKAKTVVTKEIAEAYLNLLMPEEEVNKNIKKIKNYGGLSD